MHILSWKNVIIAVLVGIIAIGGVAFFGQQQEEAIGPGFVATDNRSCEKLARNYANVATIQNETIKQEYTYIRSVYNNADEACIGEYRIVQELFEAGTLVEAHYIHNLKTGALLAQFIQYEKASFDVDQFNQGARARFLSDYREKSIELFGSSTITE